MSVFTIARPCLALPAACVQACEAAMNQPTSRTELRLRFDPYCLRCALCLAACSSRPVSVAGADADPQHASSGRVN